MTNTAPSSPRFAQATALDDVRAYDGVRTRRSLAFLFDYTAILILSIPAALVIGVLGVVTLGLGWALYAFLLPVLAILYVGFTMGGSAQATPGMRLCGVRMARLDGQEIDPVYAVLHAVLFWASCSVLTPFVLLMALFTRRKQMLHDYLLGTVAVRRRPV
ncbi:RDD family protein [Aureimonas populi]|uniref:RDD family protein n=1 Tax=Aureimonas populi TaxID=1701758 RepID=A0ABW5CGI3_9HYPH|nr:RDD family protein [Aureimonas populi]